MDEVLKTSMRFLIFYYPLHNSLVTLTIVYRHLLSLLFLIFFLKAEHFREQDKHGDIIINLLHCQSFILLSLLLLSFSSLLSSLFRYFAIAGSLSSNMAA